MLFDRVDPHPSLFAFCQILNNFVNTHFKIMKAKSLIARLFLALSVFTAAVSCVKFDDSEIQSELDDIKSRLTNLEEKVNTNIANLWEIVNSLDHGIKVTSVTETDDAWIIQFSNGKTATLSKGGTSSAPAIGVKQDTDGIYYWTLYGEWLLDAGGKKLPVSGTPGVTPQLKIEGGYWYVSTDGGKTWTKLDKATGEDGKDGDSFFKNVTWDDEYVYLTLSNGTTIKILRGAGLVASIAVIPDYSDGAVKAGTGLFTIRFKVEPGSAAEDILYLDSDCFKLSAAYTETKASAGDLTTLPVHELDVQDGILTLTTDGESLASEFAGKKLGVSAALFISDENFAVTSGYFPLYPKNEYNGHGYVDLGLDSGNKFADTNLGADDPWDPGNYYAWGELEPKKDYSWATYKWCDGTEDHMTKYNETDGLKSFADDNYKDDVARQEWGGEWHIPTKADWDELMDESKYTWTKTSKNGSKGYEIKSKKPGYEGESIFLPAAGYRDGTQLFGVGEEAVYWSSTLYAKNPTGGAIAGGVDAVAVRCYGLAIRPVLGKYVPKSVKGVSLDRGTLTMVVGSTRQLSATVEPAGIKNPKLSWTSSDPGVATVAKDGTVTAVSVGTTTVTVKTVDGGFTATCTIKVVNQSDIVPEYVDLGLSVKWATFNLGATTPDDYGDYFAWGETETKEYYSVTNYKWGTGKEGGIRLTQIFKYNTRSSFGDVDNITVLFPEDDVAHVKWGGIWRMPTNDEWKELLDKCSWIKTEQNGIKGILFTGSNGNSIFLPAAGVRVDKSFDGFNVKTKVFNKWGYWSSSLYSNIFQNEVSVDAAWGFHSVYSEYSKAIIEFRIFNWYRKCGVPVRPVYGEFVPVSSISLDKPSLELESGEKAQLTATVSPSNASAKDIHWASSDESVATVDFNDGSVTAVAPGTATIAAYGSSGVSASCTVTVKKKAIEPEYVDLGLPSGTKWATFNVGASKPEEDGDPFSWGETETKDDFSWSEYKFLVSGDSDKNVKCNKYCTLSLHWGGSYPMDNKTVLDPEDDVAQVNWGGSWRMPTRAEWEELRANCTWRWRTVNGVQGMRVTSKMPGYTDRSIFLPAPGHRSGKVISQAGTYGCYWSSNLYVSESSTFANNAWGFFFGDYYYGDNVNPRCNGFSVRPVYGEFIPVKSISLDQTTLELNAGDKQQLTATVSPSNATAKDVHWASSDESVAKVDQDGLVTAVAPGTATITAYGSSGVSAICTVTVKEGVQAVDLGLPSGLKWASCNVGATKPEEFGDYFAWGETEPKASYDWSTYKWCNGASDALTKYCFDPSYWGGTGQMDNKKQLDLADDAANANMGGDWRMPTNAEWQELIDNCTVTWTSNYNGTGVAGSIFTGKKSGYTGVSIFIPAAGWRIDTITMDSEHYCYCWTSVLDDERYPSVAYYWMSSGESLSDLNSFDRADGRSVRAVCP